MTDGAGLGRIERYLASLRGGLDAHPHARAKGSLVRSVLEGQPVPELLARLPPPLHGLVSDPPMESEWVPEVHLCALIHAVADLREMADADLFSWARERNRALFRSPLYRLLMAVASPGALLRFADRRWGNWHRGSTLRVDGAADDGVRLTLEFPDGLFDALLLRAFAQAFVAALEVARARTPEVRVEVESRVFCRYLARW